MPMSLQSWPILSQGISWTSPDPSTDSFQTQRRAWLPLSPSWKISDPNCTSQKNCTFHSSRLPLCLSFPFHELSLFYTYYLGKAFQGSKWWWKVISPSEFLFPHLWNKRIILNNFSASSLFNLEYLWLLYLSCSLSPLPSHHWHFVITSSQHLNGPSFLSHSSYLAF